MGVYLDNASTTFPKPPCVTDAVLAYMTQDGANIGRGGYAKAYDAEQMVFETREQVSKLFGADGPEAVAFAKNITEALNVLLKGILEPGDHVVVSSMEHNAVMRPLVRLQQERGVSFSRAQCDERGRLDPNDLPPLLTPRTRAVVMTHASNVCGTVLPLEEVGHLCHERGLLFFVDSAQTAGVLDLDMKGLHADALAFTGHKGLLGPQGVGGLVLRKGLAEKISPLIDGGTGSASDKEVMPEFMPDHLEAGTQNLPGIAGLHASLGWLEERGSQGVRQHELALAGRFLDGLTELEARGLVRVVGLRGVEGRTGVVSLQTPGADEAEVAFLLDQEHQVMTRVGLHCAPSAHRTLKTFPTGTIRFSFGWANDAQDVDTGLAALEQVLSGR